jgi:predicted RNA polymerase sigma factor
METWTRTGPPENPSAWLHRVASNRLLDELRGHARHERLVRNAPDPAASRDDVLRFLFVCCDDAIPLESQLVLALRTVCGFDVREISERLFLEEENVYKRLTRARERLRARPEDPGPLSARTHAVLWVLYVLFTEGHLSYDAAFPVRRELCDEAKRLTTLLAEHPETATTETFALLALMCFHGARMPARQDPNAGLLLLEEQDRSAWDRREIAAGLTWLARSAEGEVFSRFHAEAGIAAEHCLAPSFAATRWDRIVECYELLERLAPSALHTLNRAVAVAEWRGPDAGLAVVDGLDPPSWLAGSWMWSAVLADLHRRRGDVGSAQRCREAALASAPSIAVRKVLERRLAVGEE